MIKKRQVSIQKYFKNPTFDIPFESEKIRVLVDALRLVSEDEEIMYRKIIVPDSCEQYGFVEGSFNLSTMIRFLADMLEE